MNSRARAESAFAAAPRECRDELTHLWVGKFGQAGRRLAPVLGIAPQSVYGAAARGAARAEDWARLLTRRHKWRRPPFPLTAMLSGFVTEEYARMEHRRWLETLPPEAFAVAPGASKAAKAEEGDIKSAAE